MKFFIFVSIFLLNAIIFFWMRFEVEKLDYRGNDTRCKFIACFLCEKKHNYSIAVVNLLNRFCERKIILIQTQSCITSSMNWNIEWMISRNWKFFHSLEISHSILAIQLQPIWQIEESEWRFFEHHSTVGTFHVVLFSLVDFLLIHYKVMSQIRVYTITAHSRVECSTRIEKHKVQHLLFSFHMEEMYWSLQCERESEIKNDWRKYRKKWQPISYMHLVISEHNEWIRMNVERAQISFKIWAVAAQNKWKNSFESF